MSASPVPGREIAAPHVLQERHTHRPPCPSSPAAGARPREPRRQAGAAQRMLSTAYAARSGVQSLQVPVPV